MTMRRHVFVVLTVLTLAGCASTHDPTVLRPDLRDDVSGGIQTRELNSVIRGR